MSNKTADDLRNVKKSHGEAEQRAKETVEDAIEDLDFVSVYTLKHSNRQDSIAMQLEFSGLEDLISEQEPFEELDDYADVYVFAYTALFEELQRGNEVYVNISSMPRTVAFAFATAAGTIAAERPALRESVHTYYVAPDQYLVLKMFDQLEAEQSFLKNRLEDQDDQQVESRLREITELLETIYEHGITKGAKAMNGDLHVEFPSPPVSGLREFEGEILSYLQRHNGARSVAQLAKGLADQVNTEFNDSFRSRVQYTVSTLDDEGYIERTRVGNRNETRLSTMGKLWSRTHGEEFAERQ